MNEIPEPTQPAPAPCRLRILPFLAALMCTTLLLWSPARAQQGAQTPASRAEGAKTGAPAPSEFPTARGAEEPAAKVAQRDPAAAFAEGTRLARAGQLDRAKDLFQSLIVAHPDLPEPYINLGVVLTLEKQAEAAAASLEKGILLHPVCRAGFEISLVDEISPWSQSLLSGERRVATPTPTSTPTVAGANTTSNAGGRVAGPAPASAGGGRLPDANSEDPAEQVAAKIFAWAGDWSAQDTAAYLAHYSPEFRPNDGNTREQWMAIRQERVTAPEWIEVQLQNLQVNVLSPTRAAVSFDQTYRSNNFTDSMRKVLVLARDDGEWRIIAETDDRP